MANPTTAAAAAQKIVTACEGNWEANQANCSGFVKAVAKALGVVLTGQANDIVDAIQGVGWTKLGNNGVKAEQLAAAGWLVIAGLKGPDQTHPETHGHVAVVVPGPFTHGKYPTGYWGKYHGVGKENAALSLTWIVADLPKLIFGARRV